MKNIIVTVGEIALGIALFFLIFGTTGSFRAEGVRIFNATITDLQTIAP